MIIIINATSIDLGTDEVFKCVSSAKKCVTNCPITALRFELLQQLIGKHRDADEQVFLNNLTWLLNNIGNGRTPTDVSVHLDQYTSSRSSQEE